MRAPGLLKRILVLASITAVAVLSISTAATTASAQHAPRTFRLLQMNLCLSGIAGCYPGTQYPSVVDEAIGKIEANNPDIVTAVETCSGDAERIAHETGYHLAFGTVIYNGAQLPCVKPGNRGLFGISVLTRRPIIAVNDTPYKAQHGNEERRRVCATTVDGVTGCVTHLTVPDTDPAGANSVANNAQCAELRTLLAQYARLGGPVLAGGDMNRHGSCAPANFWTQQDTESSKDPGIQHAYGVRSWLHRPSATVLPMQFSDHNALLVTATLVRR
jgi:endonuclease/exonuclease/phosphatase (EEP) superfamily protein YafD